MRDIIEQRFGEWTGALEPVEARISVFEKIRDIPFAVELDLFSIEEGLAGMLRRNRGFCVPKHNLLGMMYRKLGIPVRYCTYAFKWNRLDIDYPAQLRKLADNLPVTYHLACKAFIEGRWALIDATWDAPLRKAAFPVNENWDGRSDTLLAVNPLEEFVHEDPREREKVFKEKMMSYTLPEKLELSRFSGGLNRWLEGVRCSSEFGVA